MLDKILAAAADLKSLLELGDYCVWDVNPRSSAHKLGLLVGVTLPWPGGGDIEKILAEIKEKVDC